jgi:predicted dehydrogenase
MNDSNTSLPSRRDFLKTSALIGGALAAPGILPQPLLGATSPGTLRVGLIGCGGRGTGAANQALRADPNVVLTALGDVFEEQVQKSLQSLQRELPDKVKVTPDKCFVGLDAYQKVIDSGVDVVLLAAPPGFRPEHLKAAVAAGKHVFCEKPVATDAAGIRSVLETVKAAREKSLALVAGFCWRYEAARREFYQRIHEGAIGAIRAIYATYYAGPVKPMPPASQRTAGMTDLEWQLRHWYNFVWLSGDGYVEQACHSVDKVAWAMKDQPPLKAVAVGGRQTPNNQGISSTTCSSFMNIPTTCGLLWASARSATPTRTTRTTSWGRRVLARSRAGRRRSSGARKTGAIGVRKRTCTSRSIMSCLRASAAASPSTTASG